MRPEEAFGVLLRHMPVGLVVWQLDADLTTLRLICANEAAEKLSGAPLRASSGKSLLELFPHLPAERMRQYAEIANSPGDGTIISLPDTRTERTTFSLRALAMPKRCVGVIFQDLADQVGELTKREERFRTLIQNSADAIVLTDAGGRPTFASDSVTQVVGYRPEELVGRDGFLLVHPDDLALTRSLFSQMIAHPRQRFTKQIRAQHADGSWRRLEVVTANYLDDPNVGAVVSNFRDITERDAIEEALRKTREQLLQAQKMEAIGQLAAGVAHDFNNLLSVVLSYADILIANDNGPNGHSELDEIRRAGLRAAELTQQLLAFSRQQVLAPHVINLNETLRAIEDMVGRIVGEDIELRVVLAPDLWNACVDPGQIEQVLMNLVVNARDAMREGGSLTIETHNVVLDEHYASTHAGVVPGPHVMIAVSDTGVGMDRNTQDKIFDPFFTTKEKYKGTGLGLSTVFGIVKQSGGSVWVYSEVGQGTTFKVYFPRTEAAGTSSGRSMPAPKAEAGNERIMLVEDDASVRAVSRTILEMHGYRVLEAASGADALQLAECADPIDLLVTDVIMPKMSGRDLAERLIGTRPDLRVLYVSGYTDNTIVHHGVLDEGVAFLQKPITPGALASKVREVLDAK